MNGTLRMKQARYAANGIDAAVTFIPGNYVAAGVLPLLTSNGFDTSLPSFFIWEGNTMYLTRPDVMRVLTDLRRTCGASPSPSTIWTRLWSR